MRRLIVGVVATAVASQTVLAQPKPNLPSLQRIVEFPYAVHLRNYCSVPSFVAGLARRLAVPAGIEYLSGPCHSGKEPREMEVEVDVLGVTVEAALDRLVAADPRYRWTESGGLIVLRPVTAWSDPANWLHQSLTSFHLPETDLFVPLLMLVCQIPEARCVRGAEDVASRTNTEQGARRFSLELPATSIIEALNAIVRSHGTAWWEARDRAGVIHPGDSRMLWVQTPDGSGLGLETKRYPQPK